MIFQSHEGLLAARNHSEKRPGRVYSGLFEPMSLGFDAFRSCHVPPADAVAMELASREEEKARLKLLVRNFTSTAIRGQLRPWFEG